jgi:hypothetical protein
MDSEEREIYHFLSTWGAEFVSLKEISRRAGGKQKYHQNPDWAKPVLNRMQERGVVVSDAAGRFRLKPVSKKEKTTRWVAPDIAKILAESGVKVEGAEGTSETTGTEEYYDGL